MQHRSGINHWENQINKRAALSCSQMERRVQIPRPYAVVAEGNCQSRTWCSVAACWWSGCNLYQRRLRPLTAVKHCWCFWQHEETEAWQRGVRVLPYYWRHQMQIGEGEKWFPRLEKTTSYYKLLFLHCLVWWDGASPFTHHLLLLQVGPYDSLGMCCTIKNNHHHSQEGGY